jgi:hypothetical protein
LKIEILSNPLPTIAFGSLVIHRCPIDRTMAQPEPPPHPPPQLSPRAEPQVVTIEETMDERLGGVNSCGRKFLSYCKTNGIKPEENIPKVDIKFKVCTFHFHLFTSTS